jgi:acyl-CoA thioester hydrolase
MSGYVECFRGVVYPWHCDHQGHMTVMHYVGMFDQAFWHLISAIGFSRAKLDGAKRGFVDVKSTIEYKAEQGEGALLVIDGGLLRFGTSSVAPFFRMKNCETGELAATMESVTVYFDLAARTKLALSDDDRTRLEGFVVERIEQ